MEPGTGVMDRRQMQPFPFGKPGVSAAIRILEVSKQLRQQPVLGYAAAFISIGLALASSGWHRTSMRAPRS